MNRQDHIDNLISQDYELISGWMNGAACNEIIKLCGKHFDSMPIEIREKIESVAALAVDIGFYPTEGE